MTTANDHDNASLSSLIANLDAYLDAGIDPAFDADMDDLDRQFAEIRLTFDHN